MDLRGVHFTVSGEPLTPARLKAIRLSGAAPVPVYGSVECGYVGYGCLLPEAHDDVHVLHDLNAIIQVESNGKSGDAPGNGIFLTSLRSSAPFILLNTSIGDQGLVSRRSCDCPMEQLGWGTHLHTIRSFEKLTAGGMTFLDTDVIRILEEILVSRFGGMPTDYQLLEEEEEGGKPRLRILVHPALGKLDAGAVRDTFLTALGRGSGPEQVMEIFWANAGLVRVERRPPQATYSGKILHVHIRRQA
jgi:hypothetical protein